MIEKVREEEVLGRLGIEDGWQEQAVAGIEILGTHGAVKWLRPWQKNQLGKLGNEKGEKRAGAGYRVRSPPHCTARFWLPN